MEALVPWFSAESVTIYFTGRGSFYYFNDSAFGTQGRIACSILT